MEEKRGRRWRGWLGFGRGEVNTNKKKEHKVAFYKISKEGRFGKMVNYSPFHRTAPGPIVVGPAGARMGRERFGQHTDAPKMRANNSDRLK